MPGEDEPHDGSCPECGRTFTSINIGPDGQCVFCAAE